MVMTIKEYIFPETLEETYEILMSHKDNTIIAGCTMLKMCNKKINYGIDLQNLNLCYINEEKDSIKIGAMTTLREIELASIFKKSFSGIIIKSIKNLIGIQLRSHITAGATVFSRYGFSEFITVLLALNAKVKLYNAGEIELKKFLERKFEKDILIEIIIPKSNGKYSFLEIRNSYMDYALLNVAVSKIENKYNIAVGARPYKSKLALKAAQFIENNCDNIEASRIVTEELDFGSNMRASAEYRKEICKVLVSRALEEVLK